MSLDATAELGTRELLRGREKKALGAKKSPPFLPPVLTQKTQNKTNTHPQLTSVEGVLDFLQ